MIEFTQNVQFLFEPYRYKGLWGGRGGKKSWDIARALLIEGTRRNERVLCTREFQSSITDSVHRLLADQIVSLGLQSFYQVLNTSIRGRNGTEFMFAGLRHNISNLKSYEGVTKVWVEEAQNTSKNSWDVLIPTIRRESSEIWFSFNPDLESDETYQRFIINPPKNSKIVKVGWQDNPWFPDVLKQELEYLKEKDHDAYLNVWEGHCKQAVDGAVYANEIREAVDRITEVPHIPSVPVMTFWDLGDADGTAIWFIQKVGMQYRVIDYYYNCHHKIAHYFELLQTKPYLYGTHYLPHDADWEVVGQTMSIRRQFQTVYPNANIQIVEGAGTPGSIALGIDAARNIFSQCWFDKSNTADGLQALRHYHYKKDIINGKTSLSPVHDWSSHGASAFMYFAMSINKIRQSTNSQPIIYSNRGIV